MSIFPFKKKKNYKEEDLNKQYDTHTMNEKISININKLTNSSDYSYTNKEKNLKVTEDSSNFEASKNITDKIEIYDTGERVSHLSTNKTKDNKIPIYNKEYTPIENKKNHFAKTLTIINQKGGVGKSTTSINLSAALGEYDKRILLIDLDPQGNSTSGLGINKNELQRCVHDLLINDVNVKDIIIKNVCKNVDLIPATIHLAGAEIELVAEIARENRLSDALNTIKKDYDYIFIDCPPSLGLLTVNALVAGDQLLIPIQTEFYALEGVTKLLDSMKRVKTHLNPSLEIFGVLLTMFDGRTTLAKQVAKEVKNYFKDLVFDIKIPRAVKISEAPSFGLPITEYEPDSRGAVAYRKLAKEVIDRG